jgi:hypothetical protein
MEPDTSKTPPRSSPRKGKGTDSRVHFRDDIALQQQLAKTPSKHLNNKENEINTTLQHGSNAMDNGEVMSALALKARLDVDNNTSVVNSNATTLPPPYINLTPDDDPLTYVNQTQHEIINYIKSSWNNQQTIYEIAAQPRQRYQKTTGTL